MFQQIIENEWTAWNRKDRLICCDCSLTHDIEFRVRRGRIELKMKVNRRSTAAYRRAQGKVACKPNGDNRNGRRSNK